MLNHYVFIKYADWVDEGHIAEFCQRILGLRERIDGMLQLEVGRDILRDAFSWEVLLIMRFGSEAALRHFQQHPEHLAVMAWNQPCVTDVGCVDFVEPLI